MPETKSTPRSIILRALTNVYLASGGYQPVGAVFELIDPAFDGNDPNRVQYLKRTGQVVEANAEHVAAYRAAQAKSEADKPASAKDDSGSEETKPPRRQRRSNQSR